jgi:hypothetical protein
MPEHYTKNTVEVSVWCNTCNRMTMHRVDDGRRGPCIDSRHRVNAGVTNPLQLATSQRDLFEGVTITPTLKR